MIKTKFNPILVMLISLVIWLLLMLFILPYILNALGYEIDRNFLGWLLSTLYLSPILCVVTYNITLILNKSWAQKNILLIIIINVILIAWLINSIFSFIHKDISELWFL